MCVLGEEIRGIKQDFLEQVGGKNTERDGIYEALYRLMRGFEYSHEGHCPDCQQSKFKAQSVRGTARKAAG